MGEQMSQAQLERIVVQYENLKVTNRYLGKNNVKLMQRSTELKTALVQAILAMRHIDFALDLTQLPEIQQKVDSFFLNRDVANLMPFIQEQIEETK